MQIGAIILGDSVWEVVKNGRFQDWGEFKLDVEGRFELTQHQLLNAFYAMRPIVGEISAQFILGIEDKRVQYKVDPPNCYRTFVQFLDKTERRRIDMLQEQSMTAGSNASYAVVTWDQLVARARF